jgi:hypothetical protein
MEARGWRLDGKTLCCASRAAKGRKRRVKPGVQQAGQHFARMNRREWLRAWARVFVAELKLCPSEEYGALESGNEWLVFSGEWLEARCDARREGEARGDCDGFAWPCPLRVRVEFSWCVHCRTTVAERRQKPLLAERPDLVQVGRPVLAGQYCGFFSRAGEFLCGDRRAMSFGVGRVQRSLQRQGEYFARVIQRKRKRAGARGFMSELKLRPPKAVGIRRLRAAGVRSADVHSAREDSQGRKASFR